MKLKSNPSYTTLKYYYSDKTSSDTFVFDTNKVLFGSLILTEDGRVYFSASHAKPKLSDHLADSGIYPQNWINSKEIYYCLKYQPYDIDDWYHAYAMYSKEFWRLLISDFREVKLKYIQDKIDKNLKWVHSYQ